MDEYKPKIICFKCNFGWGYLDDKKEINAVVKSMVPVTCSGKVDSTISSPPSRRGRTAC